MAVPDVSVIGPYGPGAQPTSSRQTTAVAPVIEPTIIELPMPEQIRETYLAIQEVDDDQNAELWMTSEDGDVKVVTLLEILSPWNKSWREGRIQYERKRQEALNSYTNLVEIDLRRIGQRMVSTARAGYHYSILVSPSTMRPRAQFYPFFVQQAIPLFRLPLQEDDDWPLIDLNPLLHQLYARAAYDLRINCGTRL